MIKTILIGHLGNDATINNVNGRSVLNFSVAHTEKYKNSLGVETTQTIWVSCSYWTEKTSITPYLKKGTQVFVEGKPSVKTYTDSQNKQQAQFSLNVQQIQLLGSKQNNSSQETTTVQQQSEPMEMPEDDLPF